MAAYTIRASGIVRQLTGAALGSGGYPGVSLHEWSDATGPAAAAVANTAITSNSQGGWSVSTNGADSDKQYVVKLWNREDTNQVRYVPITENHTFKSIIVGTLGLTVLGNAVVSGTATLVGTLSVSTISVNSIASVAVSTAKITNLTVSTTATIATISATNLTVASTATIGTLALTSINISGVATVGGLKVSTNASVVGNLDVTGTATVVGTAYFPNGLAYSLLGPNYQFGNVSTWDVSTTVPNKKVSVYIGGVLYQIMAVQE